MIDPLEKQNQIIGLLAKNEEAVQKLYAVYAAKYPAYKDFWLELANKESQHGFMIHNFEIELKDNPQRILFKPDRFTPEALRSSIEYVKKITQEAQTQDYPLITALSLAMQIEQALIEKDYFEVFEDDDFQLQNTLNSLKKDSQEHLEKLKKAWEKEKEAKPQ